MKKNYLKILILIVVSATFMFMDYDTNYVYAAKSSSSTVKKVSQNPKYIKLNKSKLTLGVGEEYTLSYKLPKNTKPKSVKYTSSDKKIATVSKKGVVKAKSKGTVKITVKTSNGKKSVCTVKVKKAPQKGKVKITNSNNKVQVNSSKYKIEYDLNGAASYHKTFKSSNKKVAKVSSDGVVTGVSKGTATITLKLYNGVSEKIKVKVVDDCLALNVDAYQISLNNKRVTRIKYGKSAKGRILEAYEIVGNKKTTKTFIMTFAIHGFEDEYWKDGKVLVKEANKLVEYYADNPSKLKNMRVIIIPCLNPDGTIAGKNNLRQCSKAYGRCTYKHIDMNRDFKNGKFKAKETRAFRDFLKKYKANVFIDFHGWLNESLGTPAICNSAKSKIGLKKAKKNVYGTSSGYLFGYVHSQYNCPSALIEFKNSKSVKHKQVYKFTNDVINKYNKKA